MDRNNLSVLILTLLRTRDVIIYNLMTFIATTTHAGIMKNLAGTPPDWRYCQINSIIIDLRVHVTHENNQYKQDRTPFVLIQLRPCCDWTWKFGKL